jgi:hypothetical protein
MIPFSSGETASTSWGAHGLNENFTVYKYANIRGASIGGIRPSIKFNMECLV